MLICPNEQPLLACEGIYQSYGGELILQDIEVALYAGETVCILGASGVGKTTLFNILSGLERPDNGRVLLWGEDITGKPGKLAYMQQKDLLLPFRTIIDNVATPLVLKGSKKKAARLQAAAYFEEFGLTGCEHKYPSQLSGGMRQRAALLRSYLFNDQIMLMDEAFSALDALTKKTMHGWFRQISNHHHTSAFLVTHDIDEAIMLADRIYIITGSPGRISAQIKIAYEGSRNEFFSTTVAYIN
ncbi:MAG: ABC transporter ATP-binding protein, partial [Clostridiales bacterium]